MKKVLLITSLLLTFLQLSAQEKNIGGSTSAGRWVKVARIQNRNPIDGAEYTSFSGTVNAQTDFGATGSEQYYAIFSFGSRGVIKPLLQEFGAAAGRSATDLSRIEWRVYKDAAGWHYLWFWQSNYSRFAKFDYENSGGIEYWTFENPPADYTLVWSSMDGDRQYANGIFKSLDVKGDIFLDNYIIKSQGGSSIGLGNGGIGNENDDVTIDIANDGELEVQHDGVNVLSIGATAIQLDRTNTRKVGIGTTQPSQKLDVKGNIALDNYVIMSQGGSSVGFGSGGLGNENDDITIDVANDGELELARNNVNMLSIGDHILLNRNNSSANVGIGTSSPKNKLSVNGTIWATKVKVSLTDAADWVFEKDYKLRSLAEVKEYVTANKHLPEMPSADEFRANDMEVSEMSNKLLQKIEELTLYTIEQEEQLKAQQEKLATQEARLQKLEALLVK